MHSSQNPASTAPPIRRRLLITAGPTHEPIDAVRYLGNRSSGRLGVHLADRAAELGWQVTLLLGPTSITPSHSGVHTVRFRTTADLQRELAQAFPDCDVLVMAAAVADYRPAHARTGEKIKREATGLSLTLEATPDLLAQVAAGKRPDQWIVGFALEPRDRMLDSALKKLERKSLDMIVANPLETMDAEGIDATILSRTTTEPVAPGPMSKAAFADFLLGLLDARPQSSRSSQARALHQPTHSKR